jgi:hypothetical protein
MKPLDFGAAEINDVRRAEKLNKLFGVDIPGYTEGKNLLVQQRIEGGRAGLATPLQGRVSTYLQSSFYFAQTVFQALVALVREVALIALSLLPAIFSSQARDTLEVHAKLLLADIAALPIGVIGIVLPHAATFMAKGAMKLFEALFLPAEEDLPIETKGWLEECRKVAESHSTLQVYTKLLSMQEKVNALEEKIYEAEGEQFIAYRAELDALVQEMVDYAYLNKKAVLAHKHDHQKQFHHFVRGVGAFRYEPSAEAQAILDERRRRAAS